MRMLIQNENGVRVEAVLLAARADRMRVAVNSQSDTVELKRVDGCWQMESGRVTEIEAMLQIPRTDFSEVFSELVPQTSAVGPHQRAGCDACDCSATG